MPEDVKNFKISFNREVQKMRKFKKLISCAAAVTLAATSLVGGSSLSASADDLIENYGPYTEDAFYIGTFMREQYYTDTAFKISFKYDAVGTPSQPVPDEQGNVDEYVGYNDTFEFLVFDTTWGGWNKTTVGPAGIDITANPDQKPVEGQVYTYTVPISTIESKLAEGTTPYGINLQTGLIGTSTVSIVSLELVSEGEYVQQPFTITGNWTKGKASVMEVSPATAATVNANEYNIEVSAIDLSAWTNPTIQVTVNYASSSTSEPDEEGNSHEFAQAEIAVPTGETDSQGNPEYEAVDPNYVRYQKGTTTYTTEIPNLTTKFIAAYTECTVTKIYVYDNTEGNVTESVTGLTASKVAENMGLAWNLGNSLDAVDEQGNVSEKAYGNPKTTKKLIQAVKAAGFNTIKIPITFFDMIEDGNKINDAYMARIQQVIDYAYDMGMYVIINMQNDGRPSFDKYWINISQTPTEFEPTLNKFAAVWSNIANALKEYDQRLVFQAANELMNDDYNYNVGPTADEIANINSLNQAFVNAVRNAGGKNADRVLAVVCYRSDVDYVDGFVIPEDSKSDRLMMSFNYYLPSDYTLIEPGTSYWDPNGQYGTALMDSEFAKMTQLGLPVLIGEYGPMFKNNISSVALYNYWLNYYAKLYGIVTAYWDNGSTSSVGGTALFDRTNNTITADGQIIVDYIKAGYELKDIPN